MDLSLLLYSLWKKKKKDITFSNVSKFICLILSVLYVVVERRQQQTEPNFKLIEK